MNQSRSKFAHFSEPYHGKKSNFLLLIVKIRTWPIITIGHNVIDHPCLLAIGWLHGKQQQQPTFYKKKIVQKSLRKVIHEKTSVPKKFYLKDKYILKSVDFFS